MSTFHFKQFSLQNEKSAMKVNTDSVLLGAWAKIPPGAKTGLDIGSGTGILSLMLTQRNSNLSVLGIEIEKNAFEETKLNFENSPYSTRLRAVNLPIQKFVPEHELDCIISNPPYFVDDLKNQDANKSTARHTDSLSFEDLITFTTTYLSATGTVNLILPKTESEGFRKLISMSDLHLQHISFIKPNSTKEVNRVLMCFGKEKKQLEEETFCIYQSHQVYSPRHHELTKEFYLDKI